MEVGIILGRKTNEQTDEAGSNVSCICKTGNGSPT
jgi:hypothetical protein